jgi:hypothetical protein
MTIRMATIAFASAVTVAFAAMPAAAQFYGGPGGPYYQPGLPPPPPPYGRRGPYQDQYREPYQQPGYGAVSCGEGAQIVASEGFRGVSVRECGGRVFRYTAYRRGAAYEVRVASRTGQITMIRPI